MEMYNPSHPGEILKEDYLPGYNLSVTAFALRIGVSRNAASELVNCRTGVSTEMALRLERAFKVPAKFWLDLQTKYDLWQAKQSLNLDYIEPLAM